MIWRTSNRKEKVADIKSAIQESAELVAGPIKPETVLPDADGMVREKRGAQWHSNEIIKVPSTTEGLKAIHPLAEDGIRTNVTLCFNANQALFAARAGRSSSTRSLAAWTTSASTAWT